MSYDVPSLLMFVCYRRMHLTTHTQSFRWSNTHTDRQVMFVVWLWSAAAVVVAVAATIDRHRQLFRVYYYWVSHWWVVDRRVTSYEIDVVVDRVRVTLSVVAFRDNRVRRVSSSVAHDVRALLGSRIDELFDSTESKPKPKSIYYMSQLKRRADG